MPPGARLFRLVAAAVAVLGAAQAAGTEPDVVTVTGASPAAIHARATEFVRATGVAAGELPAARWIDPVCPHVVGLTDATAAALVEATLRRVATDAGIAVAAAPCRANVALVFAPDGGAVVGEIVARSPRRFAGLAPAAVAALTGGAAPIRWWYTSEVRDKDGMPATRIPPPALGFGGVPLPQNEDTTFVEHTNTSLVSTEDIRALRSPRS